MDKIKEVMIGIFILNKLIEYTKEELKSDKLKDYLIDSLEEGSTLAGISVKDREEAKEIVEKAIKEVLESIDNIEIDEIL